MRDDSHEDPWLLPTHQADDPSRETLPESRLHGRREGTFLVLAAMFLTAVILPIVLGTHHVIDLGYALSRLIPDREPLMAMGVPVGVLVVPFGLVAVQLVCELYGRRRASAMVWVGLLAALVTLGVMRVSVEIAGTTEALAPALAFAAFYLVAHVSNLSVFDAMRRNARGRAVALRTLAASVVASLFACAAMGGVLYATGTPVDAIAPIAAGIAMYAIACALAGVLPVYVAARALTAYLRIGRASRRTRTRAAEADVSVRMPQRLAHGSGGVSERRVANRRLANASQVQPFNSAEMRFFTEGDELASADG